MKGHSTDNAPKRILIMQIGAQSLPRSDDFGADVSIELHPRRPEDARVEVLEPLHRRSFESEVAELSLTRRCDELLFF
jgi:hypothetical protein